MSIFQRLLSDYHYYNDHFSAAESFIPEDENSARETFTNVCLQLISVYNRRINDICLYLDGKKDIDLDNEIMDLYGKIYDIRQSIYALEY